MHEVTITKYSNELHLRCVNCFTLHRVDPRLEPWDDVRGHGLPVGVFEDWGELFLPDHKVSSHQTHTRCQAAEHGLQGF